VTDETVDDVSSFAAAAVVAPAVVVVAGPPLVIPATGLVHLGRAIASGTFSATIDDERMSREHATVQYARGGWHVRDLDSHNGTHVEGARIAGEVRRDGDLVVRLGHTVFVLVRDGRDHDAPRSGEPGPVVGPELARVHAAIRAHARAGNTLLVHGESGTGKELAAQAFHEAHAPSGPFIAVNCAAIPEGVAERLLFGSRRGAFSGAVDAPGYVQAAHGGTLFLDEVAELHPAVQAKLLRVLETRKVVPMGATAPIAVELGIVAASHRELRRAVDDKSFRDDLYYRLAGATVEIPPLRARRVDLARLVEREAAAAGVQAHPKLVEACCVRPWPGNVRELRAAIRGAAQHAQLAGRAVARPEDLPDAPPAPIAVARGATPDRAAVEAALERAGGVVSVAARELGLHRTQLYRLMEKLGVPR
jgi:DNA-binding NtrC family response regulator